MNKQAWCGWNCFVISFFLLLCAFTAMATPPFCEKLVVFEGGVGGYKQYRIPGMVVTAKGTVLAYCEGRKTGKGDWDTIDLFLRRSLDGGKTWEASKKIAEVPGPKSRSAVALAQKKVNAEDVTYNNPVAIVDRKRGMVHLLFCLEYERCFVIHSDDEGVTFTKPVEITSAFAKFRGSYDWKVLATGPGHGIQLKNGRLLIPVWLSTGKEGHRPSVVATIYSDDHGKSWKAGEIAIPNTEEWVNPSETAVVELADGRVMLNARNESKANRRLVTFSSDGATGWTKPQFAQELQEPICMGSIQRFTVQPKGDKNRIVFSNPDNLSRADHKEEPGKGRDRKNLSIKLSYDEGGTWTTSKTLEPGLSSYSDLAVMPDGTILCLYERGRAQDNKVSDLGLLTLARFNLEWLTDGKDSIKK
jgi:sialidase-1